MINLIKWLIFGHIHKFEEVETCKLTSDGRGVGMIYVMRCDKCGEMKTFEVSV